MPRVSRISLLSEADRRALEEELLARGFADYQGIADWYEAKHGEPIGLKTVWQHGQKVKKRMEAIKASTEAARLIASAAPDEEDYRSAAVMSMVQSELFGILVSLQEAGEVEEDDAEGPAKRIQLMTQAARAISDLSRASVSQKKHAAQVSKRIKEERDAELAAAVEQDGGAVTADRLRQIMRETYGV